MDIPGQFPDTLAPPWDELVAELKDRYLPPDHSLRVKLRFIGKLPFPYSPDFRRL